ncbi:MAG: hypothetical protein IJ421_00315 [Prevotella sp.]|nr:hypothetical protein [Prevotella sp.]
MRSMLDKAGFQKVWTVVKNKFVAKVAGKDLSTNDYIDEEQAAVNVLRGTDSANVPLLQQLAALLGSTSPATTTAIPTLSATALATIAPGMYRITSSTRRAIGIPDTPVASGPGSSASDTGFIAFRAPGGLLCVLDMGVEYGYVTVNASSNYTGMNTPCKVAIFIDSSGNIYTNSGRISDVTINQNGTTFSGSLNWGSWVTFEERKYQPKRGIKTITTTITATESSPFNVVDIVQMTQLPYTTGYVIGPACAALTVVGRYMAATSGTFPAGTYYYEIF